MERPDLKNVEELKDWIINIHEKYFIELKKAVELPAAFWESYSAFCNTSGGWILLGVIEGYPENTIQGVGNISKTQINLWDMLSNPNKINYRSVDNEDVHVVNIDGAEIMIICVKEAPESMKPVYFNGKRENTFIRTGDGDRRATKQELEAFERNAMPCHDSLPIEYFTIDDLDMDSVITYKEKVNKRFPKKNYLEMSNQDFLTEIGACFVDRASGEVKLRRGALLFLGQERTIKEAYPHYHLDYFNRKGHNPRWIDRISDDEPGDYEMNIFNFYSIVYEKMKILLKESFELDEGQLRIPLSDFDEVLRECLINCLAHADYVQAYPSIKIEVFDGWFHFLNPGKMLVSLQQFRTGGDSRPRNEIIMKMFRWLGASERQGYGGPLIYTTTASGGVHTPEVYTDIEKTDLRIWNIDFADSYPELEDEAKTVLRVILKSAEPIPVSKMREETGLSDYKIRKWLETLGEKKLVQKIGNGPATRYIIRETSDEKITQLQIALDNLKTKE